MVRPIDTSIYEHELSEMDQSRLRFRAYRQAKGAKLKEIDEIVGIKNWCSKFEKPGGPFGGEAIWALILGLPLDAGFLFHGDLDRLPHKIALRVEAILNHGSVLQDGDVQEFLANAGLA